MLTGGCVVLWRTGCGAHECKQEVIEIIQVRDDSLLDQGPGGGSDEKGENLSIF